MSATRQIQFKQANIAQFCVSNPYYKWNRNERKRDGIHVHWKIMHVYCGRYNHSMHMFIYHIIRINPDWYLIVMHGIKYTCLKRNFFRVWKYCWKSKTKLYQYLERWTRLLDFLLFLRKKTRFFGSCLRSRAPSPVRQGIIWGVYSYP